MSPAGVIHADFRSDSVTRPSEVMRQAMAVAEVADDILDGDPPVGRLEQTAAAWLGKEEALFVPSGTMANQVALGVWTQPGDEVIAQAWAHVSMFEAGAPGYLHGVQTQTLGGADGLLDPDAVAAAIRPRYIHCPQTRLLCLEQTHNAAGGRVLPEENFKALHRLAQEHDIRVHLDGARLPNAVVASGVPAERWASYADSVSVCVSKGLDRCLE